MTDYILTNTDRHLINFGVLRDTKTLKFIGMAPIFDSGNSMFWQDLKAAQYMDIMEIAVDSFAKKEIDLWKYVKSPHLSIVDLNLLPTEQELYDIYAMDSLIPYAELMVEGYKRKVQFITP